MTGTYGEWLWCQHPQLGAHATPSSQDCPYYRAATTTEPSPPLLFKRD